MRLGSLVNSTALTGTPYSMLRSIISLACQGGPGCFGIMDAGAVGKGDQQLAVHGFDKVQQAQPLILLQHILEALGNHTRLVLTIKIIVGLVGPGAGNTDPDRTEGPGQVDQTLILGIDGGRTTPGASPCLPGSPEEERARCRRSGRGCRPSRRYRR